MSKCNLCGQEFTLNIQKKKHAEWHEVPLSMTASKNRITGHVIWLE